MKIVYIEDENGEVFSEDKKRRFTRLVGTEAYEYLKSAEGKNKVFFKTLYVHFSTMNIMWEVYRTNPDIKLFLFVSWKPMTLNSQVKK